MSDELEMQDQSPEGGLDRRSLLRRGALLGGAIVWTTPVVQSLATPAFEMRSDWNLHQYLAYLRSWSASQRHLTRTGRDVVQEISGAMHEAWGDPGLARSVRWPLLVLAGRP